MSANCEGDCSLFGSPRTAHTCSNDDRLIRFDPELNLFSFDAGHLLTERNCQSELSHWSIMALVTGHIKWNICESIVRLLID